MQLNQEIIQFLVKVTLAARATPILRIVNGGSEMVGPKNLTRDDR